MNIVLIISAILVLVVSITRLPTPPKPETAEETVAPVQTPMRDTGRDDTRDSEWVYPNSSVVSAGDVLVLSSNDDTDTITEWYKNKINAGGYNIRNSIKTSANEVTKNVLQAVGGGTDVSIEITKEGTNSQVRIEVEVD